jgi:hypothetical protein
MGDASAQNPHSAQAGSGRRIASWAVCVRTALLATVVTP